MYIVITCRANRTISHWKKIPSQSESDLSTKCSGPALNVPSNKRNYVKHVTPSANRLEQVLGCRFPLRSSANECGVPSDKHCWVSSWLHLNTETVKSYWEYKVFTKQTAVFTSGQSIVLMSSWEQKLSGSGQCFEIRKYHFFVAVLFCTNLNECWCLLLCP